MQRTEKLKKLSQSRGAKEASALIKKLGIKSCTELEFRDLIAEMKDSVCHFEVYRCLAQMPITLRLLLTVCLRGHLAVAKSIYKHLSNVCYFPRECLENACVSGNIALVEWAAEQLETPYCPWYHVFRSGNMSLLRWAQKRYPGCLANHAALRYALHGGSIQMCEWIVRAGRIKSIDSHAWQAARSSKNPKVWVWAKEKFSVHS